MIIKPRREVTHVIADSHIKDRDGATSKETAVKVGDKDVESGHLIAKKPAEEINIDSKVKNWMGLNRSKDVRPKSFGWTPEIQQGIVRAGKEVEVYRREVLGDMQKSPGFTESFPEKSEQERK